RRRGERRRPGMRVRETCSVEGDAEREGEGGHGQRAAPMRVRGALALPARKAAYLYVTRSPRLRATAAPSSAFAPGSPRRRSNQRPKPKLAAIDASMTRTKRGSPHPEKT